jgi:hypothetical protein
MALRLDFNAGRSFVDTGSGTYMLHPVMTMSPVNIAAEVTGKVEFQDQSANPLPLPDGVVVNAYVAGDRTVVVGSAAVDDTGSFRFAVLPQGTYDFEIISGYNPLLPGFITEKVVEDVLVTAPTTDLGTIIIVKEPAG